MILGSGAAKPHTEFMKKQKTLVGLFLGSVWMHPAAYAQLRSDLIESARVEKESNLTAETQPKAERAIAFESLPTTAAKQVHFSPAQPMNESTIPSSVISNPSSGAMEAMLARLFTPRFRSA